MEKGERKLYERVAFFRLKGLNLPLPNRFTLFGQWRL